MKNTIDLEKMEGKLTSNFHAGNQPNAELKAKISQIGVYVFFILMSILIVLSLVTNDALARQLFASFAIIIGLSTIRLISGNTEV